MANKIRAYKFEIVPIVQILDDDGEVVGEGTPKQFLPPKGSPAIVYGCKKLEAWAKQFPEFVDDLQKLIDEQEKINSGNNGLPDANSLE